MELGGKSALMVFDDVDLDKGGYTSVDTDSAFSRVAVR